MSDELVSQPTLIGVLVTAVTALAATVVYLYRRGETRQTALDDERKTMATERQTWAIERIKTDVELEGKLRAMAESYAKAVHELDDKYVQALREERNTNRDNEDKSRKEFADLMEAISSEAAKSAEAIRAVLQKFLDRFVGPRRG